MPGRAQEPVKQRASFVQDLFRFSWGGSCESRSVARWLQKYRVQKTVAVSNSSRTGLAVAGLSLGTALNPLNSSVIAVALVVLREDFRLDFATVT
jgi:hypothetical protein